MNKVLGWFLVSCAFGALSAALSIVWWHTRQRAVRAERLVDRLLADRTSTTPHHQTQSNEILDIIASEVERLGEGQRFLTNTLLERTRVSEPPHNTFPRAVTPH
jgi:hypothetical protein